MRRGKGLPMEVRVMRSAGLPLAGGAALTVLVAATQNVWWVGPAMLAVLALVVFVLCRA